MMNSENTDQTAQSENTKTRKKRSKKKYSGAYYYVAASEQELAKKSFIRTILTVVGLFLQSAVLLLEQGGTKYVLERYPSYAYVYVWLVFVALGVTVYIIIMNFTRYKLAKRIPIERAPKSGFKRRAFLGHEIYMAVYAALLAVEISFVCLSYDGMGLLAVFMCAAALAAAVAARQITHLTLKNAELINNA